MSLWVAFLCGVNVGKRQMKMGALRLLLEENGYGDVKTILASGNVRFTTTATAEAIKSDLETIIAATFGFKSDVILRSGAEMEELLAKHPFASLDPEADLTRHVILYDKPLPVVELESRKGDVEILRVDERELYFAGYRQANGRYTENVEDVLKPLGKAIGKTNPGTMRNWNTMEKILK
ncbi:DUF1697 domain-containing protein [Devosia rhizoryzae]|uniref:DUF1697 domain-containing protein n=1 Tax=Devosia rhizoryzae TaxID=2774137 RepID=A0ABX7C3S0_9HYPH|nr:DUF1697 domain-containing protein [Devosia rhizoryzae]QQR38880.1 DUF1697 domain-containing protein [Devosia rhizoryzae]